MKIGLANQLIPARFNEAVDLGKQIVAAVNMRDEHHDILFTGLGVNPKFGLPDANWHPKERNDFRKGYDLISTFEWEQVRHLRFRSQNFNGFSLLHMEYGKGSCADQIPIDYDQRLPDDPPANLEAEFEVRATLPYKYVFRPKALLGEVGWTIRDILVNTDVVAYQERMFLLYKAGLLDSPDPRKVLEIGGGYGALAYAMVSAIPGVEYWICDLPESLLFSGMYLTMTTDRSVALWPGRGQITLVPNYLFAQITSKFDLFINTLSLAEMTEYQARMYISGIRRLSSVGSKFFEQNYENNDLPDGTPQKKIDEICAEEFSSREILNPSFPLLRGPADVWSL